MRQPAVGLVSSCWDYLWCPSCSLLNQKSENENEAVCPWPPRRRLLVLLPTIRVNFVSVRILIEPRTMSLELCAAYRPPSDRAKQPLLPRSSHDGDHLSRVRFGRSSSNCNPTRLL